MKRKLIRAVLALLLCLLLAVPAFAAGSGSGAKLFNPGALIICLLIGFVIALIPMGVLKGQVNNVHSKTEATSYTREGSFMLQGKEDNFLYRNVQRVPIPRNNNNNNGH